MLLIAACGSTSRSANGPVSYRTGINPAALAVAGNDLWVANSGEGTISRIDLQTRRTRSKMPVGDVSAFSQACKARNVHQVPHGSFDIRACDLPAALALGAGALWVAKNDTNSLLRVDPASGRVVATIPIGINTWYVQVAGGSVWATDSGTNTLVRLDPRTNTVVATITGLPNGPTGLAVTDDAVWVASSRADAVARVDTRTNRLLATIPVGHTPVAVAAGFGSVWVRNANEEHDGSISRIDPATNRVEATIPIGLEMGRDGLDGLAVTGQGVWVCGLDLERIDPSRNRVSAQRDHMCNAAVGAGGALWTIDIAYSVTRFPAQ